MERSGWDLEVFVSDAGQAPFSAFLDGLDDFKFVALDTALRLVLTTRGLELMNTEWLKALGQGLHVFRVRHTAEEIAHMFGAEADEEVAAAADTGAVLLRTFVHFHGRRIILLLSGYDKGEDSSKGTQQREIAKARKLLSQWQAQQQRQRKAAKKQGSSPGPIRR